MIKNIIIAILTGIAIAQQITPPGEPGSLALALGIAIIALMTILEVEDLWDKRQRIIQRIHNAATAIFKYMRSIPRRIHSRIRRHLIQLCAWPVETARRRRRNRIIQDYIRCTQDTQPRKKSQNSEEREA